MSEKVVLDVDKKLSKQAVALLKEVKKLAIEISPDYIWLDTHISNENAIRLYEKNGFKKLANCSFLIGTQIFDYYIMGLPISRTVAV